MTEEAAVTCNEQTKCFIAYQIKYFICTRHVDHCEDLLLYFTSSWSIIPLTPKDMKTFIPFYPYCKDCVILTL